MFGLHPLLKLLQSEVRKMEKEIINVLADSQIIEVGKS